MFEDSMFDTTGMIRTRSRGWMLAAFLINSSFLLLAILIPLLHPEALPQLTSIAMLTLPPAPQPAPVVKPVQVVSRPTVSEMDGGQVLAPTHIPHDIVTFKPGEDLPPAEAGSGLEIPGATGTNSSMNSLFATAHPHVSVHPESKGPVRISSSVATGLLLNRTAPAYPQIARAARVEGTVVLQAMISPQGSIENLRVTSGPTLLRQAAIESVSGWRYQPWKLNGEPVEVETTISVIFTLNR